MTVPQRISVKFYFDDNQEPDIAALLPVFHRWIQQESLPGLLIDVADYKHVPHGPLLLIVGHEGDYILDKTDGRMGLLYRGKREWPGDELQDRLRLVWQRAHRAGRLLQEEPGLSGISFIEGEAAIDFPDRLNAPNDAATFESLREDVQAVLAAESDGRSWTLARAPLEARRPLRILAGLSE